MLLPCSEYGMKAIRLEGDRYLVAVISDLLQLNLQELTRGNGFQLSPVCLADLATQLGSQVALLHHQGQAHRDIKVRARQGARPPATRCRAVRGEPAARMGGT
jgi:hypothetical protein